MATTTTPFSNNISRRYCLALTLCVVALSGACHKANNYTWQQVLRTVSCEPRTPQAKAQLGGCPKVADLQHQTPDEIQEFVAYMNKKDAIEGSVDSGGFQGPGCLQWRIDSATGRPVSQKTGKKEGCLNLEQLQNYKLP
jgi:hypothetical protein